MESSQRSFVSARAGALLMLLSALTCLHVYVTAAPACVQLPKCSSWVPCPGGEYAYCQTGPAKNGCQAAAAGPFPSTVCSQQCVSTTSAQATWEFPTGCTGGTLIPAPPQTSPSPGSPTRHPPSPQPPLHSPPPSVPASPTSPTAPDTPGCTVVTKCASASLPCPAGGDYLYCLAGSARNGCSAFSAGLFPAVDCSLQCASTPKAGPTFSFPLAKCSPEALSSPPFGTSSAPPPIASTVSPPPQLPAVPSPQLPPRLHAPPPPPTTMPEATSWPADWRQMLGPPTQPPCPFFLNSSNPNQAPVTSLWGPSARVPYPTGQWWANLVLGDGTLQLAALPYLLAANTSGLQVGGAAITSNTPISVGTSLRQWMSLQAQEGLATRHVQTYDELSVTLRFYTAAGGTVTTPLFQGMPFVTAIYDGVTPMIVSETGAVILSVSPPNGTPSTSFTVTTNAGMMWRIYTSQPVTFRTGSEGGGSLVALRQYSGLVVRLALVQDAAHVSVYDANVDLYPTSATTDWGYSSTTGSVRYNFNTASMSGGALGGPQLMMMAWPHHMQVLVSPQVASPPAYFSRTLRGTLVAVLGSTWTLQYNLGTIVWTAPRAIARSRVAALRSTLLAEAASFTMTAPDPYHFGSQVAAAGRLILIAEELGDQESLAAADSLVARVKQALAPWLRGQNQDKWRYDTTWGGLIPEGTIAHGRQWDFGAGIYNDHHFHSGYFIYGIAVVGRSDPVWLARNSAAVLSLVRDYANPARDDLYFPPLRYKDSWAGHSWANGLDVFGDNKNMESTSESVNAYYALQLLGEALGSEQIAKWGATLAAQEVVSVQNYWHMWSGRSAVGPPFSNNKVVGILWSTKSDYLTWWSPNVEYVTCIQMLPFTPISELLLAPTGWVQEVYPRLAATATRASPRIVEAWRAFVYMAHALLEPQTAWDELQTITMFNDPDVATNTKTNALYWAATRPGA